MEFSKAPRIFVAVIGGILLLIAILLTSSKKSRDIDDLDDFLNNLTEDDFISLVESMETTPPIPTLSGYDITGTWYSDPVTADILTLNQNGTYSSGWLSDGTYEKNGENITLTNNVGFSSELLLMNRYGETVLQYSSPQFTRYYSRAAWETEPETEPEITLEEEEFFDEERILYEAALKQILTTGDWVNYRADTTLTFTEDEFTVVYDSNISDRIDSSTYSYKINDIKVYENGTWLIKFYRTNEDGLTLYIKDVSLEVKDNNYTLFSSSFPYSPTYYKQADIVFSQSGIYSQPDLDGEPFENDDSLTLEDIEELNLPDGITVPPGATDISISSVQINRTDYPVIHHENGIYETADQEDMEID